jgi:hypothetical protein
VGVDVGWAPVSSGCLGAYNLRCGLQGKGKRIVISVVGSCRYMSVMSVEQRFFSQVG